MRLLSSNLILLLFIFAAALGTRLLSPDVPTNLDETFWIERGVRFFIALFDGQLEQTYLRHHPGVINMWLTGCAFSLRYLLRDYWALPPPFTGFAEQNGQLGDYLRAIAHHAGYPAEAYVQVRLLFAPVTAITLTGFYLLTERLLGQKIAFIAAMILLLEPFFLTYQRFITTDANQSNFTWLALLSFLLYLRSNRFAWGWLFFSSLCYGLALLSKVAALLSLPAIGLCTLWGVYSSNKTDIWPRLRDLFLWGLGVMLICWLLWPALWIDLSGTLTRLVSDLRHEVDGHSQFFLGEITRSPNYLFYPVLLLWRLSPTLLVGGLFALFPLLRRTWPHDMPNRAILIAISLNLLLVLLGISSQSSKIDRYMIPLIPGLAILASVGWLSVCSWLTERWLSNNSQSLRWDFILTLSVVLLLQLSILSPHFPINVTYFNPLMGGAVAAEKSIMIGNGELLEQAAIWLNSRPRQAEQPLPKVASWYHPVLRAYYDGPTTTIGTDSAGNWGWGTTRYAVLYVNQIQRNRYNPEQITYFVTQDPLHVISAHGVNYVYIYDGAAFLPSELAEIPHRTKIDFAHYARLLGYEINTKIVAGERALLTLYWEAMAPFPDHDFFIVLRVQNASGQTVSEIREMPVAGFLPVNKWEPGQLIRDVKQVPIAEDTPLGQYDLLISFYSKTLNRELEIITESADHQDQLNTDNHSIKLTTLEVIE